MPKLHLPEPLKYLMVFILGALLALIIAYALIARAFPSLLVMGIHLDAVALTSVVKLFDSGHTEHGIEQLRQQVCAKRTGIRLNLNNLSDADREFLMTYLENTSEYDAPCEDHHFEDK